MFLYTHDTAIIIVKFINKYVSSHIYLLYIFLVRTSEIYSYRPFPLQKTV